MLEIVDNLRLKFGWRCALRWTVLNCHNGIVQINVYVELNNISHGQSSQGSTAMSRKQTGANMRTLHRIRTKTQRTQKEQTRVFPFFLVEEQIRLISRN